VEEMLVIESRLILKW